MSLAYIKGSDVESNQSRQHARLLGISNENYVYHCNQLGNLHNSDCQTMYEFELITHPVTGEEALVIEDTTYLPSVHIARLLTQEEMESEGWFVTE